MVIILKNTIYNLATMWLTLSVIFFIVEYLTGWLVVVTLGGLVAGAFIEGVFMLIGLKLVQLATSKEFFLAPLKQALTMRTEAAKALVVVAALSLEGAINLCRMLPGYELNFGVAHGIFLLLLYPGAALVLQKQINSGGQVENGN